MLLFHRTLAAAALLAASLASAGECPSHYVDGRLPEIRNPKMSAATKAFAQPANDIKASVGNVAGVFGAIALPAVGAATALAAFANSASEASASFDTMKRTFAGALGGVEQGAQAMAYLENYAGKSAFGLEDLARASVQLAATGLDVGRFLPIIERFALVVARGPLSRSSA